MTTENVNTPTPATSTTPVVEKPKVPEVPLPNVTLTPNRARDEKDHKIELVPIRFKKKSKKRAGQFFFGPKDAYFSDDEALKQFIEFIGPKIHRNILRTWARGTGQKMDNVLTDSGKEQLDQLMLTQYWEELSTRGEPIGEMRQLQALLQELFKAVSNLEQNVSEQSLKDAVKTLNDAAIKTAEEESEEDDDADPVTIPDEFVTTLVKNVTGILNNQLYRQLPDKTIVFQLASKAAFDTIASEVKTLSRKIEANAPKRKSKSEKASDTTEATPATA